jgi:hypothetical protein
MERMWALGGFDGFRQKQGVHTYLPRFGPPKGKDLHPACLILYYWYMWSCYNSAQMQSGGGGRRWRALAYAWDLCEISCLCEISLCEFGSLGGAPGGFIYAAS